MGGWCLSAALGILYNCPFVTGECLFLSSDRPVGSRGGSCPRNAALCVVCIFYYCVTFVFLRLARGNIGVEDAGALLWWESAVLRRGWCFMRCYGGRGRGVLDEWRRLYGVCCVGCFRGAMLCGIASAYVRRCELW